MRIALLLQLSWVTIIIVDVVTSSGSESTQEKKPTTQGKTTNNYIIYTDEEADEEECPAWLSTDKEAILRSSPLTCEDDEEAETTTDLITETEGTATTTMKWSSTSEPATTSAEDSTNTETTPPTTETVLTSSDESAEETTTEKRGDDKGTDTQKTPTKVKSPNVTITRDSGEVVTLYFVDERTTWSNAHISCRKMGLNLGEFRSQQESADAMTKYRSNHCDDCEGMLWVGAQRIKESDSDYEYLYDKIPVPNAPDFWLYGSPESGDKSCLAVSLDQEKLVLHDCFGGLNREDWPGP
ncbi:hypothetical protein Y032_0219g2490 [Ancylostoma ceylanicum]|uniref:C-type lectin domain-containing protein n=1 Tax=Ancylostoma ceylanicum TaxID=53326 RepID=A0A016SIR1_9BILA|nr:hypothetical protein Y032_0219g2490 [Ancylostoma ceylanicum]